MKRTISVILTAFILLITVSIGDSSMVIANAIEKNEAIEVYQLGVGETIKLPYSDYKASKGNIVTIKGNSLKGNKVGKVRINRQNKYSKYSKGVFVYKAPKGKNMYLTSNQVKKKVYDTRTSRPCLKPYNISGYTVTYSYKNSKNKMMLDLDIHYKDGTFSHSTSYSTSNSKVATVTKGNGKVTIKGKGKAKITARAFNGATTCIYVEVN